MSDSYARAQIDLMEQRIRALEIQLTWLKRFLQNPRLEDYMPRPPSRRVLEARL